MAEHGPDVVMPLREQVRIQTGRHSMAEHTVMTIQRMAENTSIAEHTGMPLLQQMVEPWFRTSDAAARAGAHPDIFSSVWQSTQ